MRSAVRNLSCLVMSVVFPASIVLAESNGAMVRTSGQATLNGAAISRNVAILKGDLLSTGNGSAALSAGGNTVVVPGNSSLRYGGSSISLQSGHAQVTTATGFKSTVEGFTVSPTSKSARYEVARENGEILIAALSGSVEISDSVHSAVLDEGFMTSIDAQDTVPSPGVHKDKDPWWQMKRKKAILIWAGVAGAGALIAWWLMDKDKMSGD